MSEVYYYKTKQINNLNSLKPFNNKFINNIFSYNIMTDLIKNKLHKVIVSESVKVLLK